MFYSFEERLCQGKFIKRINRFTAEVFLEKGDGEEGKKVLCHVPSSGRMKELLTRGAEVLLKPAPRFSSRKTSYDLALVWYNKNWVYVDSRLPNRLFEKAVAKGLVLPLENAFLVKREPVYKNGRFDLLYDISGGSRGEEKTFVECKSVTLVENNKGLFPDAPTSRGTRHLEELGEAVDEDYFAYVVFLVQRSDARVFSPNWKMDKKFSETLLRISNKGVGILAYYFSIGPCGFEWGGSLPVELIPE